MAFSMHQALCIRSGKNAGLIYVTYAKQDRDRHDDVPGPGHGYVSVFDADGNFINRLVTRGAQNSLGLTIAPNHFGNFRDLVSGLLARPNSRLRFVDGRDLARC